MENASKALIIAASVLIAIMIVALGVTIFNKAQNAADTSSLDATEISMFNNKFERYADNQLGSQVKSLMSTLISNASNNRDNGYKLPTIVLGGGLKYKSATGGEHTQSTGGTSAASSEKNFTNYFNDLSEIRNVIVSTHTYKVELSYGKTGLVDTIKISQ